MIWIKYSVDNILNKSILLSKEQQTGLFQRRIIYILCQRHRYTVSDSEFEFPSQWAAGVEPREAAQRPHRKHIPVRGVADGTAFIKHSRNVLLKKRETTQHILLDRVLRTQRTQMNFRYQETALLTCGQSPLGSCLSIKTWMPRSITLMSGYLHFFSIF